MTDTAKDEKHAEFNKVIDATSNFLKSIFPHARAFIKAIKTKITESNKQQ
jgi:hypothetical protein